VPVSDDHQISLPDLGGGDEPRVSDERPRRVTSKRIGAGDIVEIDRKGRRFHAVVEELAQQESGRFELTVRPLDRRVTYRSASVREVVGVWRRVR
jgi:hypothetical protein